MSAATELALIWTTIGLYAVSTVLFVFGSVFAHRRLLELGLIAASAGLALQVTAFVLRWARVGRPPYVAFYETVSSFAFVTVTVVVVVGWLVPRLRPIGMLLMPLSLLALAASMFADESTQATDGSLASWWLTVHVIFTQLAMISFVLAFALAVAFLLRGRPRGSGRVQSLLDRLPSQDVVDDRSFRLAAVGLILWGIMIIAGAIWANELWGRYWGWDPIETWSLVVWLVYALYLHLRLTLGWRGRKSAWYLVAALPVGLFTFIGVPLLYSTIHVVYVRGL
jgi:cytochrome c-type biogenesis protein CcsB